MDTKSLLINTGNIAKRKSHTKVDAKREVTLAISSTLKVIESDTTQSQCRNPDYTETIEKGEREDLLLTVKIFLNDPDPALTPEAVSKACEELNVSYVDLVVLSFPGTGFTVDMLKPHWKSLEALKEKGIVSSMGICNLDKPNLEELFTWAKVKPVLNQINVASCCVIPKDLNAFAKENDIRLVTTSDPHDILSADDFHETFSQQMANPQKWKRSWLSRYSTVVKSRGVVRHRGYLLKCLQA
ncbi:glutamate--cysteine ligase regulatory subunit-like [Oscarella lobularis]|uniref:glutamate--cysteine ligase regulatory subunit-like n=1 Tax=Oscarella lobularis TaxID=121494 RepID=UPI0033134EDB